MPDLRPAAIYVRVSSKEQVEGYSLDAQRRACLDLAAARGFQVVAEYADEGVSAFTDNLTKRPAFARMLADAERGCFSVVIVHKMDRFARHMKTSLECLDRLGRARVGLVSVSEPDMDYSTPQGFLFLSLFCAWAEYYSRNLATETKKGWAERKRQGLYAGRLPYGVMKGEDGVPGPDTRPVDANGTESTNHAGLLLAFERAAAGLTDAQVAEALNAAGYRPNVSAKRAIFTKDSMRVILQNRFYVGELPTGKRGQAGWTPGAHAPIVPEDLFAAVQRQRARRAEEHRTHHVAVPVRTHVTSGLVICGVCGGPMRLGGRAGIPRLMCTERRQGAGCPAVSVKERTIEQELGDYLARLSVALPVDSKVRILAAYRARKPARAAQENERRALEGKLRRLMDLYIQGDLERAEYEAARAGLKSQIAALTDPDVHSNARSLQVLEEALRSAQAIWSEADAPERNRLLRTLFTAVEVRDQHVVAIHARPEYQPLFILAADGAGQKTTPAAEPPGWQWRARGAVDPQLPPMFEGDRVPIDYSRADHFPLLRLRIRELRSQGLSLTEVGRIVGLTRAGVHWHLAHHQDSAD